MDLPKFDFQYIAATGQILTKGGYCVSYLESEANATAGVDGVPIKLFYYDCLPRDQPNSMSDQGTRYAQRFVYDAAHGRLQLPTAFGSLYSPASEDKCLSYHFDGASGATARVGPCKPFGADDRSHFVLAPSVHLFNKQSGKCLQQGDTVAASYDETCMANTGVIQHGVAAAVCKAAALQCGFDAGCYRTKFDSVTKSLACANSANLCRFWSWGQAAASLPALAASCDVHTNGPQSWIYFPGSGTIETANDQMHKAPQSPTATSSASSTPGPYCLTVEASSLSRPAAQIAAISPPKVRPCVSTAATRSNTNLHQMWRHEPGTGLVRLINGHAAGNTASVAASGELHAAAITNICLSEGIAGLNGVKPMLLAVCNPEAAEQIFGFM